MRPPHPGNLLGRTHGDDLTSARSAFGPEIDHPIGSLDDFEVMLDDQQTAAVLDQPLQRGEQLGDVVEVQPGRGLVEDVQCALAGSLRQMRGQFHPLCLAAR